VIDFEVEGLYFEGLDFAEWVFADWDPAEVLNRAMNLPLKIKSVRIKKNRSLFERKRRISTLTRGHFGLAVFDMEKGLLPDHHRKNPKKIINPRLDPSPIYPTFFLFFIHFHLLFRTFPSFFDNSKNPIFANLAIPLNFLHLPLAPTEIQPLFFKFRLIFRIFHLLARSEVLERDYFPGLRFFFLQRFLTRRPEGLQRVYLGERFQGRLLLVGDF
jgi:hypothetical protein